MFDWLCKFDMETRQVSKKEKISKEKLAQSHDLANLCIENFQCWSTLNKESAEVYSNFYLDNAPKQAGEKTADFVAGLSNKALAKTPCRPESV